MSNEMVCLTAATLLAGIHGSNGNHSDDQIRQAVTQALKIEAEVEAQVAAKPPKPPQP